MILGARSFLPYKFLLLLFVNFLEWCLVEFYIFLKKMTYRTWGTRNCFQNFSSSVPAEYSTVCFIVPRKENIKVKLLNFLL